MHSTPTVHALGITADDLARVTEREQAELERRVAHYRVGRLLPALGGRDVVLVDDGLATGVTARAAIAGLQKAAGDTAAQIRADGVEVVALVESHDFRAVGFWYDHFEQTTDDEVLDLLRRAASR